MVIIMVLLFIMLSDEQAIMAAEAGESARPENTAAVIKIFFNGTSRNKTNDLLASEIRSSCHFRFAEN